MWTIEQTITKLLEKRWNTGSLPKKTDGIEDYTCKKIIDVTTLKELFDTASRVRNRLSLFRSYWDISLFSEIDNYLKNLWNSDFEYKKFFDENLAFDCTFDSYNSMYKCFCKVVRFLEEKKSLSELKDFLNFLRSLDAWDNVPLSDEALMRKFSC